MKTLVIALSLAASLAASPSFAQAVSGFGGFKPLPEAGEQPDPSRVYRVIFDVSQGGADDRPLKGLDRVARLVNMLAAGGVDADHRQIVVVLHGAATPAVLSDAAWTARRLAFSLAMAASFRQGKPASRKLAACHINCRAASMCVAHSASLKPTAW